MIDDTQINSIGNGSNLRELFRKRWQLTLFTGIALVLLGTVSIALATLTTIISVIILGSFLFMNGVLLIPHAIIFWTSRKDKFFLELGLSILYMIAGIIFILNPINLAISLTAIFAIFYLILGMYRSILAISHKPPSWGWALFSGLTIAFSNKIVT